MSDIARQLIDVQELVTHLQHELQQIHEVVLSQQSDISALRREISQLKGQFEGLAENTQFPSPEEDRPPHY